jgi:hypothetical protein
MYVLVFNMGLLESYLVIACVTNYNEIMIFWGVTPHSLVDT